jgi:hypothetical protein
MPLKIRNTTKVVKVKASRRNGKIVKAHTRVVKGGSTKSVGSKMVNINNPKLIQEYGIAHKEYYDAMNAASNYDAKKGTKRYDEAKAKSLNKAHSKALKKLLSITSTGKGMTTKKESGAKPVLKSNRGGMSVSKARKSASMQGEDKEMLKSMGKKKGKTPAKGKLSTRHPKAMALASKLAKSKDRLDMPGQYQHKKNLADYKKLTGKNW